MDPLGESLARFSKVFLRMKLLPGRHPKAIRKVPFGDGAKLAKEWSARGQGVSVSEFDSGLIESGFELSDLVHFFKGPNQCVVVLVYSRSRSYSIPFAARREMGYLLKRVWAEVVVCHGEDSTLHFLMTGPDDDDRAVPDVVFRCEDGFLYSTWAEAVPASAPRELTV